MIIMKRIYIIRHAKSSWGDMSQRDIDRPLNSRGKKDAPIISAKCLEKDYIPELMITSNAKRAMETCLIFEKCFSSFLIKKREEPGLYHAPENKYFEECALIDDQINSIMLFGHNPGITYLANSISKEYIDNIPTCGVLVIDSSIESWVDIDPTNCKLVDFIYPKMFL